MDDRVAEAVKALKKQIHYRPKFGIILGSGHGHLANEILEPERVKYSDIPNFPTASVVGHLGEVIVGKFSGTGLFTLAGRVHYHEGYAMDQVVFPIRVMAGFGVTTVIVTNAAGAINESYNPGDIITITDHINMMGKIRLGALDIL